MDRKKARASEFGCALTLGCLVSYTGQQKTGLCGLLRGLFQHVLRRAWLTTLVDPHGQCSIRHEVKVGCKSVDVNSGGEDSGLVVVIPPSPGVNTGFCLINTGL